MILHAANCAIFTLTGAECDCIPTVAPDFLKNPPASNFALVPVSGTARAPSSASGEAAASVYGYSPTDAAELECAAHQAMVALLIGRECY